MTRRKNKTICGTCDGPRPMINFKKATKRKTCTDRFDEENNRYTENCMEQENKARLQHVKQHNLGYPSLCDELAKKKSLTQITTIKSYELAEDFDPDCDECLKLAAYMKLRNLKPQPRCCLRRRPSHKRVSKKRQQRRRRPSFENKVKKCPKRAPHWINRSIQCMRVSKDKGTNYDLSRSSAVTSENNQNNQNNSKENCITLSNDKENGCDNVKVATPHPSMSSYNSYASFSHEPMEQQ